MMLQIQYWISKNTKLFMAIVGLLLASMVYALYATYSDSTDARMEHESEVLQEIEEVNKEKEAEITQDVLIPEKVKALPTREEIQAFFDANADEFKESQVDKYAMKRVAEEFGDEVRLLVEEGYLVSANLSPEEKLIMQLQQGEFLYTYGYITDADLGEVPEDVFDVFKVNYPLSNVSKYKILNFMGGSPKHIDFNWLLHSSDREPFTEDKEPHGITVSVDVSGEVEFSEVVRSTDLGNGLVVAGGIVMKDLDLANTGEYYNDVWLAFGVSDSESFTEMYDKLDEMELRDLKGNLVEVLTPEEDPTLPPTYASDSDTQKVTGSRFVLWRGIVRSTGEFAGITINDKKIELSPITNEQLKAQDVLVGLY